MQGRAAGQQIAAGNPEEQPRATEQQRFDPKRRHKQRPRMVLARKAGRSRATCWENRGRRLWLPLGAADAASAGRGGEPFARWAAPSQRRPRVRGTDAQMAGAWWARLACQRSRWRSCGRTWGCGLHLLQAASEPWE